MFFYYKFASSYPLHLLSAKKYRYFYAISSDVDAENPGTVSDIFEELIFWSYLLTNELFTAG